MQKKAHKALMYLLRNTQATNSPPAIAALTVKEVRKEAVDAL